MVEEGDPSQLCRWWTWVCRPYSEFKEDFDKIKAKLDNAVNDVSKLKVQVEILKKDYVIIAAVCVGVVIGCILSTIWK